MAGVKTARYFSVNFGALKQGLRNEFKTSLHDRTETNKGLSTSKFIRALNVPSKSDSLVLHIKHPKQNV